MAINPINAALLDNIATGFNAVFNESFELADKDANYSKIATIMESNNATEHYAWLGDFPSMREWVDERTLSDLTAYDYSIKKKDWEVTIEVDRDDIIFDRINMVKPRIVDMANSVPYHYDEMLIGLLSANGICFDGKAFFAADHAYGGITYSNIGDKKLTQESFLAARTGMMTIKSDTGRNMFIKPNLLIVPPELELTALKIIAADQENGSSNLTKGMTELIVSPFITNPNGWYLLDTARAIRPLILQITKKPEFVAMNKPEDERAFMAKKFRYGVDTMDNAGYGLWQLAFYSDGSVA